VRNSKNKCFTKDLQGWYFLLSVESAPEDVIFFKVFSSNRVLFRPEKLHEAVERPYLR